MRPWCVKGTQPASVTHQTMLLYVVLALLLPLAGMTAVFTVYLCLLCCSSSTSSPPPAAKGLTASELEKLPRVTGKELVKVRDCCAVCLEEIEREQQVRVVPGCNHGFHLECADAWFSSRPACPICRANVSALLFRASNEDLC